MSRDHRLDIEGTRISYSCSNRRFHTNINTGRNHGIESSTRGSVFNEELVNYEGFTLWLEYVHDLNNPEQELFWLMWYDPTGKPTIPMSCIFDRLELSRMISKLTSFIPQ